MCLCILKFFLNTHCFDSLFSTCVLRIRTALWFVSLKENISVLSHVSSVLVPCCEKNNIFLIVSLWMLITNVVCWCPRQSFPCMVIMVRYRFAKWIDNKYIKLTKKMHLNRSVKVNKFLPLPSSISLVVLPLAPWFQLLAWSPRPAHSGASCTPFSFIQGGPNLRGALCVSLNTLPMIPKPSEVGLATPAPPSDITGSRPLPEPLVEESLEKPEWRKTRLPAVR